MLEISSFYTYVPKTTIIWYTVPKIQSETDRIFCHFVPLFHLLPPPPPKNQNFEEKMKKIALIYYPFIHTYMCTINENHMIYGSWNIRCNRQKFFSLWAIFYPPVFYPHVGPFTLLWIQKLKFWKNEKIT